MELAKDAIALLRDIAWPVTILAIALIFRKPLIAVISGLSPDDKKKERNLRLRLGSFELESLATKTQERINAIAEEPDLKKRLEMAKEPFLVDEALKEIDAKGMETLEKLYDSRIANAFNFNWYEPQVDSDAYRLLSKLGLVNSWPMYDGDDLGWITPTGIALLKRLHKIQEHSDSSA